MTQEWRIVLGVAAGLSLFGLLYLGAIYRAALADRRRRRWGLGRRIAARIHPPHSGSGRSLAEEWQVLWRGLAGLATDQPRGLPLAIAVLLAPLLFLVLIDPVLGEPVLWAGVIPADLRAALPGWLRLLWLGVAVAVAVGNCLWIRANAPRRLSRQWLVLHDDGTIEPQDGDMPLIDPARPFQAIDGIRAEGSGDAVAGAVIEQDGAVTAFVYFAHVPRWHGMQYAGLTPAHWHRVDLGPDHVVFEAFFERHYLSMAPGPDPEDESS